MRPAGSAAGADNEDGVEKESHGRVGWEKQGWAETGRTRRCAGANRAKAKDRDDMAKSERGPHEETSIGIDTTNDGPVKRDAIIWTLQTSLVEQTPQHP